MKFAGEYFCGAGGGCCVSVPGSRRSSPRRQAGQPSFRSAIDVVSMNVTVTDQTGRYITDSTEKDSKSSRTGSNRT